MSEVVEIFAYLTIQVSFKLPHNPELALSTQVSQFINELDYEISNPANPDVIISDAGNVETEVFQVVNETLKELYRG